MKKNIFILFVFALIAFNGISQSLPKDGVTAIQIINTDQYASVITGPDGDFYGLHSNGEIDRWTINPKGKLSAFQTLQGIKDIYGSDRLAVGLAFAPNSSAANPVVFVIHSTLNNGVAEDSKMSRLTGINLQKEQLVLTDLSSSTVDHLKRKDETAATQIINTDQYASLTIGPDGNFYGLHASGEIDRWTMNSDGRLSDLKALQGVSSTYDKDRLAIGLTFAPDATAANPVAFVIHSTLNNGVAEDNKMSRLSGSNLQEEQLILTDLSSSIVSHLSRNSVDFPSNPATGSTLMASAQPKALANPSFQIAPNSTKNIFSINVEAVKDQSHRLVIMDNLNNVHYEKSFAGAEKEIEIEINSSDLEAGIYYVIVENDRYADAQQLIVYK